MLMTKEHGVLANSDNIGEVGGEVEKREQVTAQVRHVQDLAEFNTLCRLAMKIWLKSDCTNASRINNDVVGKSDGHTMG